MRVRLKVTIAKFRYAQPLICLVSHTDRTDAESGMSRLFRLDSDVRLEMVGRFPQVKSARRDVLYEGMNPMNVGARRVKTGRARSIINSAFHMRSEIRIGVRSMSP